MSLESLTNEGHYAEDFWMDNLAQSAYGMPFTFECRCGQVFRGSSWGDVGHDLDLHLAETSPQSPAREQ